MQMRLSLNDPRGRLMAVLTVALSLAVAGCGSISRPDVELARAQAPAHAVLDPFRFAANDEAAGRAFLSAWQVEREALGADGITALAVSGGGANGAYGAGVLVGWTQAGDRPVFDLVTGGEHGRLDLTLRLSGTDLGRKPHRGLS
jgi:hypothetical protein